MADATGTEARVCYDFRRLLANSATFRTWTGTADEAGALARAHEIQADASATFPFALVYPGERYGGRKIGEGGSGSGTYGRGGTVAVELAGSVASGASEIDAFREFVNKADAILDEILELADTDHPTDVTYRFINIESFERTDGPARVIDVERGQSEVTDEFMVRWELSWDSGEGA